MGDPFRGAVVDDRVALPFQWYTAELCDQWFPAVACDGGLEAGTRPVRCFDLGFVSCRHLRHRRVVLAGQRLEHGGLHDPFQPVQSPDVAGRQVVLDESPILGPVRGDDGVVAYGVHLALITARGTRSAITPLTVRRPRVCLLSLCWAVIS